MLEEERSSDDESSDWKRDNVNVDNEHKVGVDEDEAVEFRSMGESDPGFDPSELFRSEGALFPRGLGFSDRSRTESRLGLDRAGELELGMELSSGGRFLIGSLFREPSSFF